MQFDELHARSRVACQKAAERCFRTRPARCATCENPSKWATTGEGLVSRWRATRSQLASACAAPRSSRHFVMRRPRRLAMIANQFSTPRYKLDGEATRLASFALFGGPNGSAGRGEALALMKTNGGRGQHVDEHIAEDGARATNNGSDRRDRVAPDKRSCAIFAARAARRPSAARLLRLAPSRCAEPRERRTRAPGGRPGAREEHTRAGAAPTSRLPQ